MKLLVDDREPDKIFKYLAKEGIEFEKKRLEIGDIVFPDKQVIFERKSVCDFIGSFSNGSLQNELMNQEQNYPAGKSYLIISGSFKDLFFNPQFKHFTLEQRLGMLASIAVRYNSTLVQVDNDEQLVKIVKKICDKTDDGKELTRPIIKVGRKSEDTYLSMLRCFPGISAEKAKAIKEACPNLLALQKSLREGVFCVNGLGVKLTAELKKELI